jgi:DNA invertase Pin-like site-specific DNA recombinase
MMAAIYCRKSTAENGAADDAKSVTRQLEQARSYAASKGWPIAEEFIDDGVSGAEFASRPGYMRLLNALRPRAPFQVLIVSELSRLGREQLETGYAVKLLSQAGVKIHSYLEGREIALDSPTDKFLMSAVNFASEIERERARQRTYDALMRKAQQGRVTGGRVFGYRNVERCDIEGRRSHVEREIVETEAAVVRRIFELYAAGRGLATIARTLNEEGATCPRPQQDRPKGWAPSSVREVLRRPLYRGQIVWNKSRKRDQWGQTHQRPRDAGEWIRTDAPALRLVAPELAKAVDERLAGMRTRALRLSDGRLLGRPPGEGARYLLTGLVRCGLCGGTFEAMSRASGKRRAFVYGCAVHRRKGDSICQNALVVPMAAADVAILEAVESTLLDPAVVARAFSYAIEALEAERSTERRDAIGADLAAAERAVARLTAAIAEGGELSPLVEALRTQEARRQELRARLATLTTPAFRKPRDGREQLERHLVDWRGLLRANVEQGQQALRRLIDGRITFTPRDDHYEFRGTGTVQPMLAGVVQKLASPTGFEPVLPARKLLTCGYAWAR